MSKSRLGREEDTCALSRCYPPTLRQGASTDGGNEASRLKKVTTCHMVESVRPGSPGEACCALRLIRLNSRQNRKTGIAANGVQNPVNHAGSQGISRGGHRWLR